VDEAYIINSLKEGLPKDLPFTEIEEVFYYGAGVHNEEKVQVIEEAFKAVFTASKISVGHDLLAAARALLGDQSGFAAILGTGTNTCIYDGKEITYQIDSAAYILGDEGSGCYIGKKILTDYLRNFMPENVRELFWETYKITPDEIQDNVYTKPLANRFCASFSRFAFENKADREYGNTIVRESFRDFFKNLVSRYPNYQDYSFNCIGSVGYSFRDILTEVATEYGMKIGKIISSPIHALVKYHVEIAPSAK
jgi:N-acetylglucosamine kinase-like BadF-type ATPase